MNPRTWKAYEQKVAEMFGYKRALMKGTDEKADAAPADGSDPEWIIDAKVRTDLSIWSWMAALEEYAQEKNKPAILVFKVFRATQSYAVVERKWFFGSFQFWIPNYRMEFWKKNDQKTFQKAFAEAELHAGDSRVPGLLMNRSTEPGNIDYVCVKIESLLRLMECKGMLVVA